MRRIHPVPGGRVLGVMLDQLLDGLPPIPVDADESLKAANLGPPPEDIPLP